MKLNDLRTLGRSGLPVSPLALGTMTMGNNTYGSPDDVSRAIFDAYIDAGGNFIDTADVYSSGRSETLLGRFISERHLRDRVVLATKYAFNFDTSGDVDASPNPLAGGSSRKNLYRALDGSLKRLGTDYIDLYWMHVWDGVTPAEEVVGTMSDLVRAGKIRYYGFSDVPAWFATRAATLAQAHGDPAPIAMQMFYSLADRSVEREHIPAGRALGMSMIPWSPLAAGLLSGKYTRENAKSTDSRLSGNNPFGDTLFTEQNWRTVDALREVAEGLGLSMSRVALAWLLARPGVDSIILGARKLEQLQDNLAALEVELSADAVARLEEATGFDLGLYGLAVPGSAMSKGAIFGGAQVLGGA
ncbi:aldo/keto reductase [bacterium]|nr:MAG: aldo/keto reductase [bacterium]